LEFVIEADEVPQWGAVEQFKMELADLVSKYGLRFGATGGFKNEAAVKQFIERHWAKQDRTSPATSEPNLDALRAEADRLNAQYIDRVQRRVEKAVRRLIDKMWKAKLGAALRSMKGMSFPNKRARWNYAAKRTGIYRDEITGGVLEPAAAWVNNAKDLERLMEQGGSRPTSMLQQAVELGSDSPELAQVIIAARSTVKVPKRSETIAKMLEGAEAVYQQEHAAEIEADVSKQREINRSRAKRVPWVSPSRSGEVEDSPTLNEPSSTDEPAD
jgi:hypothetical protein